MKKVLVGIAGAGNVIRADSEPLSDDEARQQLVDIIAAEEQGPGALVKLPWLVVRASDVLFVRVLSLVA